MNTLLKFNKHRMALPAMMLVATFAASAQNPVESTHIDEKYAYTTVVYKNKAANDHEVLTALESEFSIGDVVRVTLAPPPAAPVTPIAASEPVYADKNKGEDTWLPESTATAPAMAAAKSEMPSVQKLSTESLASKAAYLPVLRQSAPTPAAPALKNAETEKEAVLVTAEYPAVKEKTTVKATKSGKGKSVKKSGKKSGQKLKLKNRKRGKQGYACPRF